MTYLGLDTNSVKEVLDLHLKTAAAIMMWFVVVLLILNRVFLKSGWIWLISVALTVVAAIIYFKPRLRK